VGNFLNGHKFIHLNPLNTANKLSCSLWDIPQAVVRVTAGPGVFIVCTADNANAFCHSTQTLALLCSEFFLQYGLKCI
jgi:hypothetical protein